MKIMLHCGELTIGQLTFEDNKYKFFADSKTFKKATAIFPIIANLQLNSKGIGIYDKLPYPFSNFISALSREDIIKLAKIKANDSLFEKIYKLAKLDTEHELLWISQD